MLDQEMKEQLTQVFATLESNIEFVYKSSAHPQQPELLEMLQDLAATSSKIQVREAMEQSTTPDFSIYKNGKRTGIQIIGIPGGHEFTSLVLAILNTDGKGKWPDEGTLARIRNLRGPVRIQTYISLTCENCPDIVQALNMMALVHPDFEHTMIDGGFVPENITTLGIQGVPSVVVNQKMVHSGKIMLMDLLTKMEQVFGTQETLQTKAVDLGQFDVVVIGGGPAGASAAIYSVRKGLKTALIAEKFGGQVQDTKGIENLISVTYTEGPQLAAQLNQHVASYPIQVLEHRRVKEIEKDTNIIRLESGEFLQTKSIIISTGAKWRELGIPGEKEYLGRGVAFCPHCDGPYYKGKKIAVIGGGNSGVEAAIDLAGIVREVVLVEYNDQLKADDILVKKLRSLPNVSVLTNAKTEQILGDDQKVHTLQYLDRKTNETQDVPLDGVFVQIGLVPNSQFVKGLVNTNKYGEIIVDEKGRTSAKGIYAAGDVTTTPFKQIIIAMGEGAKAALTSFEDLIMHQA